MYKPHGKTIRGIYDCKGESKEVFLSDAFFAKFFQQMFGQNGMNADAWKNFAKNASDKNDDGAVDAEFC